MARAKGKEYLDKAGLQAFWDETKGYIDDNLAKRIDTIAIVRDGDTEEIITSIPGSIDDQTGESVIIDLSNYAKKADFTSVLSFEGTKLASEMESLAYSLGLLDKGKVYLVTGESSADYISGSEYVWTGSTFEPLGPGFDLNGYYDRSEIDTILTDYYNSTEVDLVVNEVKSEPIPAANINALFN